MNSFGDAWELICSYCKSKITDVAYNTWIVRIKPLDLDFDGNTAYLLVPNDFHRQTITRCYIPLLNEAFEAIFDNKFKLELKTPDEIGEKDHTEKKAEETGNNYEYTFDTFIVGSSNNFAHAACMAVATNPSNAYNPLFLYGNSGLGKTHLLFAIQNEIKKNYPDKNICYIKIDDFINELVESLKMKTMIEFRQKYRQVDVLLVDDVQFLGGKEGMQEEFFHTFNALYDAHKQIVLTSDRPPKEIKTLADRLRSRFEQDLIADIQPPDIETRIAIINQNCEKCGLRLPRQAVMIIAERISKNIRQIEGVINKLAALESLTASAITVDTVRNVINDFEQSEKLQSETVEEIINYVADYYDVLPGDITSKNRSANIVNARNVCFYVIKQITAMSYKAIGERFSDREHSTVIHSIDKLTEQMKTNARLKTSVNDIIRHFQQ